MVPIRLPIDDALTLFLLNEESALFSRRSRQLYGLDLAATIALLRLEQGEEPDAVLRTMGSTDEFRRTVRELAALLAGEEGFVGNYRTEHPCPREAPGCGQGGIRFRLLETHFAVEGPAELLREWILPFVAHLQTGGEGPIDLLASIEAEGKGYRLWLNGAP